MKQLREDVGAPVATLGNVSGMGSAVPAQSAAMTGSQQGSPSAIGSGDKWSNSMGPYTQSGSPKKRKKRKPKKKTNETFYPLLDTDISEESINPHDKIGTMMAKKMKVPVYFKKRGQGVGQKKVDKVKEELLPGGKGDGKTRKDFDHDQFDVGVEVEMEHTDDRNVSKEIAADHLTEDPRYYTKLIGSGLVDEEPALRLAKKRGVVTESIKIKGYTYDNIKTKEGTVFAGPDGVLGNKGVHIPWDIINQIMKKYA